MFEITHRQSIVYSKFGNPKQVLFCRKENLPEPGDEEVTIQILAAPIHPVDILTIENNYPIVPTTFPATGGSECVGDVIEIGCNVENLTPGDRVIVPFPAPTNIGTWTTHTNYPEDILMKFPDEIEIPEAATFSLNPLTAYVMLKDFVNLEPDDTVILNAANSAVGQAVLQLCKVWGIKSIGIIRERPVEFEELCTYLKGIGAGAVLTPRELETINLVELNMKKPKLALNAVGGKTAYLMANLLDKKGVLVTYGSLTNQKVSGDGVHFMINDISFRGFWIAQWLKEHSKKDVDQIYKELLELVSLGKLCAPTHELVDITDFRTAVSFTLSEHIGTKFIFDFRC